MPIACSTSSTFKVLPLGRIASALKREAVASKPRLIEPMGRQQSPERYRRKYRSRSERDLPAESAVPPRSIAIAFSAKTATLIDGCSRSLIDQNVDHRGCDEIKKLKSFDIIGNSLR
jgi:hypothetical protein